MSKEEARAVLSKFSTVDELFVLGLDYIRTFKGEESVLTPLEQGMEIMGLKRGEWVVANRIHNKRSSQDLLFSDKERDLAIYAVEW